MDIWGKEAAGRGDSPCKGPGVGACYTCVRKSKEPDNADTEQVLRTEDEVKRQGGVRSVARKGLVGLHKHFCFYAE